MQVCRLAGSDWGIGFRELNVIYKGLFRGILLYGMQALAPKLTQRQWERLESFDRRALLKVNRAYRTAPKSALPVLAGVLPVRLDAWWRYAKHCIALGRRVVIPGIYQQPEVLLPPGAAAAAVKEQVHLALMTKWQSDWDNATTGRLAHKFMPSVEGRMAKS